MAKPNASDSYTSATEPLQNHDYYYYYFRLTIDTYSVLTDETFWKQSSSKWRRILKLKSLKKWSKQTPAFNELYWKNFASGRVHLKKRWGCNVSIIKHVTHDKPDSMTKSQYTQENNRPSFNTIDAKMFYIEESASILSSLPLPSPSPWGSRLYSVYFNSLLLFKK